MDANSSSCVQQRGTYTWNLEVYSGSSVNENSVGLFDSVVKHLRKPKMLLAMYCKTCDGTYPFSIDFLFQVETFQICNCWDKVCSISF